MLNRVLLNNATLEKNPEVVSNIISYEVGYHDKTGYWWCFESADSIFWAKEYIARLGKRNGGWYIMKKQVITTREMVDESEF
jgi:hypothetical protein